MRPEHDARRGKGGTSIPSNAVGTLSTYATATGSVFDFEGRAPSEKTLLLNSWDTASICGAKSWRFFPAASSALRIGACWHHNTRSG